MKKILLILFLLTSAISNAQIGGGYDLAINFGGAGTSVNEMRFDTNGNLFFTATVMGKNLFAGTQIDPGGSGSFPNSEIIYGKIAPNGTQTLLKKISGGGEGRIDADGNLFMILRAGYPTAPADFGNGIINNTNGAKLLKISNAGIAQWIKNIDIGSDILSGETGKPISNVQGMQFTPDGNLYAIIAANNPATNSPSSQFTFPNRIIKFDANGEKVWHTDVFSTGTNGTITVPKIFVDDAGRLTFSIYSTSNQFYYNGESIASQMGVYSFGQTVYSILISLNADGSKKSTIADTGTNSAVTFQGLNPINGNLYLNYAVFANAKSTVAPFNNFPFVQTSAPFSGGGTLVFNTSGQFLNYLTGTDYVPNYAAMFRNGNKFISLVNRTANTIYEKNDYIFNNTTEYSVLEFLDQDFNFIKALKVPKVNFTALYQDKASITGEFKTALTFGSTTLNPSYNDTDFGTRFPIFASLKADMFIAVADASLIVPPAPANWLGVDNNWNNTANWSSGVVPDATTIVRFNSVTAQMPTTATNPTALKVIIDLGIESSLPNTLSIVNKLIINGTLKINNSGAYNFTKYNATAIEGAGTIYFNGSTSPSVTAYSFTGNSTLSLTTNQPLTISGVFKNLNMVGSNATISGNIEIANPDANAISGYSNTNFISGELTRAVNTNGVYIFPNKELGGYYAPLTLTLNNLVGPTKITVKHNGSPSAPNINFASGSCTSVLGTRYWVVTPNIVPTAGSYDINVQKSVFTNGVIDANRYVMLKRIANGSPWTFEGTKAASTQTGGTTSGQIVSNAVVTASLTGLTTFSDFVIGINSTAVANGTTVTTTTWTGATNTTWNNAANWSNGVPNGTVDAIIPSGINNYPLVYATTDNARLLTINAGITGLKLNSGLILTNGLINNSDIEISRLLGSSTTFTSYSGGISGSGKLIFKAAGNISFIRGGVINNNIEIDITNANSINLIGKVGGNINVVSG